MNIYSANLCNDCMVEKNAGSIFGFAPIKKPLISMTRNEKTRTWRVFSKWWGD